MKPLRRVPTQESILYLTFDDGPCPELTPDVLDLLDQWSAKATFFVIGQEALKYPEIIQDMLARGHSLGNHSWDHRYAHFFRTEKHLKNWILESERKIRENFHTESVGFRSPAGVVTPPLTRAIQDLDIAWIHWNTRFFDTTFPLSVTQWTYSPSAGDILLLHDRQRQWNRPSFIENLKSLLSRLRDKGFDFHALTKEKFHHGK